MESEFYGSVSSVRAEEEMYYHALNQRITSTSPTSKRANITSYRFARW